MFGRVAVYNSHRSFNHMPSPTVKSIYFDVNDSSTLGSPINKSVKWQRVKNVVDTSKFGLVTVYDNQYGADSVLSESKSELVKTVPTVHGSWDVHDHCDFCGQAIVYVAVIVAVKGTDSTVYHIGCDCVGKIFGVKWFGYRTADSAKKVLVEAAKKRKRAVEYPIKYAKELAWLNGMPEFLLNRNGFLRDMKKNLATGQKVMTKKMDEYLHRLMTRPEYDPQKWNTAKVEIDKTTEKLQMILKLVDSVDDTDEKRSKPWSAHSFVKSILDKYVQWHNPLTQGQMNGLNKVFVRYNDILKKKDAVKKNPNATMSGDANEIPW